MKHTVEIVRNDRVVSSYSDCSKKEAIAIAKRESMGDNMVFVSGDNSQCTVYLNPDGNYEITGKNWNQ